MGNRIDLWVEYLKKEKGLLPSSIRLYSRTLEIAAADLGPLETLDTEPIRAWLHAKGGSGSSFSNRLSALRSFYRWQVKLKLRADDPTLGIDAPKRRKGLPKPVRDLEGALEVLDAYDARIEAIPEGQSRAIATFIAETGLRISEACAVREQVPARDEIVVMGKGAKECLVLLTPKAREALDFLGGSIPIGARAIQRRFERAGFHPHQLRHWRATSLVAKGVEIGTVSKILRHSSPAVTMIYAEYARDTLRNALEAV